MRSAPSRVPAAPVGHRRRDGGQRRRRGRGRRSSRVTRVSRVPSVNTSVPGRRGAPQACAKRSSVSAYGAIEPLTSTSRTSRRGRRVRARCRSRAGSPPRSQHRADRAALVERAARAGGPEPARDPRRRRPAQQREQPAQLGALGGREPGDVAVPQHLRARSPSRRRTARRPRRRRRPRRAGRRASRGTRTGGPRSQPRRLARRRTRRRTRGRSAAGRRARRTASAGRPSRRPTAGGVEVGRAPRPWPGPGRGRRRRRRRAASRAKPTRVADHVGRAVPRRHVDAHRTSVSSPAARTRSASSRYFSTAPRRPRRRGRGRARGRRGRAAPRSSRGTRPRPAA